MGTERFDKAAASWDTKPLRVQVAHSIVNAICTSVPLTREMTGLEYGCGTGLVTCALAEKVGLMYGSDTSQGMIAVLLEKIKKSKISNVTPVQGGFSCLDFGSLDLIVISMTLHHIGDYSSLLSECYRYLVVGGVLVVADLEQEDGTFHDNNDGIFHFGFSLDVLTKTLRGMGFVRAEAERIYTISRKNREYPLFLSVAEK